MATEIEVLTAKIDTLIATNTRMGDILAALAQPDPGTGARPDPDNDTFTTPTEAEYLAGGSYPTTDDPTAVAVVAALARVGRTIDGKLWARSYADLMKAYDEVGKLRIGQSHYFADVCRPRGGVPSWGAQQALVLCANAWGWSYQTPLGSPFLVQPLERFTGLGLFGLAQLYLMGLNPSGNVSGYTEG